MAGQIPDARTLNSWEDAFQYPLPVVRKLEQQLLRNIDDNRQKLRSLVGGSYRELLGTAERIIEMDEQIQAVESHLGDVGRKCNARTVERIAENYTRLQRAKDAREGDELRVMAQTKVLQNCLTAIGRIVKAKGDALQAAKLLVLSRLLHKSVSESARPPAILEDHRRKLNGLRAKLIAYMESDMVKLSSNPDRLAHTLCAYVMVTSSSTKEVLRNFLQVRYDQLDTQVAAPLETDVSRIFGLYGQTLLDARELFPRRFAEALSSLAKTPLLHDEQVTSLFELNIDVYSSFIPEDIRNFTPWIRNDHVVSSEVIDALVAWSNEAQARLLERLSDYLKTQIDPHSILDSRQKFITSFMDLSRKVKPINSANAIEKVRLAFLARVSELAVQAGSMNDLTFDESDLSDEDQTVTSNPNIWDLATEDVDLSCGALKLRRSILEARNGRNDQLRTSVDKLDAWMRRVNEFIEIADEMSAVTWEDDLDLDLEDESSGDSFHATLSKQDPDKVRATLRQAIETSLKRLSKDMSGAAASTKRPAFYLRILRELERRCHALGDILSVSVEPTSPTELHRNIASTVVFNVVSEYVRFAKISRSAPTTLWDGSPALPVQCSPSTFRFLKDLHQAMATAGRDLWSSQCVGELKDVAIDRLSGELEDEAFTRPLWKMEGGTPQLTNGHVDTDGYADEDKEHIQARDPDQPLLDKDQLLQNFFDLYYLSQVLRCSRHHGRSLDTLIETMLGNIDLEISAVDRLRKSANDHWKRTYLLFGLLAV